MSIILITQPCLKKTMLFTALFLAFFQPFSIVCAGEGSKDIAGQDQINERVETLIRKMTLEEKVSLISGNAMLTTRSVKRLGIPPLLTSDGPVGAHVPNPSTAFAAGISLASTWDEELAVEVGTQIGRDARARGAHFLLGPGVNIYRSPLNGRNYEYFGEDPFLASRIAVGYIQGIQSQNVSATVKHYLANNSEYARNSSDSVVDERALREIYMPAFEAAVKEAKVGAVMGAYNLTNGQHMSENKYLVNDVLKNQWSFKGPYISDWESTYDGVAAANAGLDLEMPKGSFMSAEKILPAIKEGRVSVSVIDEKVRRLLNVASRFGWLDRPQTDFNIPRYNQHGKAVTLRAAEEGAVLLKNSKELLPLNKKTLSRVSILGPGAYPATPTAGGSGMVRTYSAVSFLTGLSDYLGRSGNVVHNSGVLTLKQIVANTKFTATATEIEQGVKVETYDNDQLSGKPISTKVQPLASIGQPLAFGQGAGEDEDTNPEPLQSGNSDVDNGNDPVSMFLKMRGEHVSIRVTGYFTPIEDGDYVLALGESNRFRVLIDDKVLIDGSLAPLAAVNHRRIHLRANRTYKIVVEHFRSPAQLPLPDNIQLGIVNVKDIVTPAAKFMAANSDVVVVSVGFDAVSEGEGQDREFQLPPGQNELIDAVANINKNTIVVLTSGGAVDVSPWIDKISALVQTWYAGQEGGTALVKLLYGDKNFSGRLPISWEQRTEDNPSAAHYYYEDIRSKKIAYADGIFVGYRGYEKNNVKPLFPFGYGLSYTKFDYKNLSIKRIKLAKSNDRNRNATQVDIEFDVTNTGKYTGADVPQIYVGDITSNSIARPIKELKAFKRINLRSGQTKRIKLSLDGRAFTYFDVEKMAWLASSGDYKIFVGRSSADIKLVGSVFLPNPLLINVED